MSIFWVDVFPLPASSYMLMEARFGVSTHIELTDHLGYEKHDRAGCKSGNTRNSKTSKKLKGDFVERWTWRHR